MLNLRAYADEGATSGKAISRRYRLLQLGRWSVTLQNDNGCESTPDVVVVSPQEFSRLEECTMNPARPTAAVLEGAELLRNLRQRSR